MDGDPLPSDLPIGVDTVDYTSGGSHLFLRSRLLKLVEVMGASPAMTRIQSLVWRFTSISLYHSTRSHLTVAMSQRDLKLLY
jgi:hypothetical protein